MKLRIIQRPDGYVEIQKRIWFRWYYVQSWHCADKDESWSIARKYAAEMINPKTEYL